MSLSSFHAIESHARHAEQALLDATSDSAAFAASIRAAELYMQALKLADNASDRSRLRTKCKTMLDQSEKYKKRNSGNEPHSTDRVSKEGLLPTPKRDMKHPVSKRILTTREKIILVEGSKLNGFKFPIWEQPPDQAEFELRDGQAQFVDSPQLPLSPLQMESFGGWKRPKEALAGIEVLRDGQMLSNEPTMKRTEKVDLVQDMTSDCSVVASLCAGTARAERGHSRVGNP